MTNSPRFIALTVWTPPALEPRARASISFAASCTKRRALELHIAFASSGGLKADRSHGPGARRCPGLMGMFEACVKREDTSWCCAGRGPAGAEHFTLFIA